MKIKLSLSNILQFHKENSLLSNTFMILSCFFALALGAPFLNILFDIKPEISSFSTHTISNVALYDVDISKRVSYYYRGLFSIMLLGIIFYYLLCNFIGSSYQAKNEIHSRKIIKTLFTASAIGIATVISGFMIIKVDISTYFLFILCLVLLLNLKRNHRLLDFDLAIWPVLIAFPFTQYFYVFVRKNNFFPKLQEQLSLLKTPLPLDAGLLIFIVLFLLICSLAYVFSLQFFKKADDNNFNGLKKAFLSSFVPVLLVPIILSLLLELSNILNIRFDIIFNHPFVLFTLLFFLTGGISIILYRKYKDRNEKTKVYTIEKYYYPLLLLGFLLAATQPWRMYSPEEEFFETANYGLAIDHFFRYGSIPIIENFDAHMLSTQIFAYLYGFLNGYEPWAPFLYVPFFIIIETFIVYFLFKRILGSHTSFLILLCLPFISAVSNEFIPSGLLALFIIKILKDKTTKNYFLFWCVAFLLCLYKLDIGFAASCSGIVTFVLVDYYQNKNVDLKKLIATGAISGMVILSFFIIICLIKGINPFLRSYEFILAGMSNQNWAIVKMGDMSHIVFRLSYYVLPIITIISLGYILLKLRLNEKMLASIRCSPKQWNAFIFFLFFALFFIFNIPRGIVRHNFEYGNIVRITSTIPLVFLMLTLLVSKFNKLSKFLIVFLISYLLVNANSISLKDKDRSLLSKEVSSLSFHEKFAEAERFNGTRIRPSFDFSEFKTFKRLLDALLKPDETYFDFSSKNYYYALVERKNPCYLNQTPLMINGDKAQDLTLEQIIAAKVPIVLMPIKDKPWSSIDEVYVDYKFYKISEYVYSNYKPLLRMGSFDIYALNDKKEKYFKILNSKGFLGNKTIINNFNFLKDDKVTKSNLEITTDKNGKARISNLGANAFFTGILESLRMNNKISANSVLPTTLKFNIAVTSAGSIKMYYNTEAGQNYSEERVKEFPINQAGMFDLTLYLIKMPHELMIAINTPTATINSLTMTTGFKDTVSIPERLDYYLAEVPRLWAEKDGGSVFNKVTSFKQPITGSTIVMNKSDIKNYRKPYFIYLEANADQDMSAKIELLDQNKNLSSFNFNIKQGKHSYAVRISSNYYWWNYSTKVMFSADRSMSILKYAFISEKGNEIYPFIAK